MAMTEKEYNCYSTILCGWEGKEPFFRKRGVYWLKLCPECKGNVGVKDNGNDRKRVEVSQIHDQTTKGN